MQTKKKVLIITAVGLALLLAVIGAAFNAIFTVTEIRVGFFPVSEEGERESYQMQEVLDRDFLGRSTAFLNLDEVRAVLKRYPGFELVEIKKDYPSKISLTVTERRELFAVEKEGGYAILDEEGRYLYDKAENVNRSSGENILLKGFSLNFRVGEKIEDENFRAAVEYVRAFSEQFGSARSDVKEISLTKTPSLLAGENYMQISTRGGVRIDIYEPCSLSEEKAKAAVEKYLSLEGTERLCGFFDIVELISPDSEGRISVSEHRTDLPV